MAAETPREDLTGTPGGSRQASELAERQFWAIARRQLLAIGLSPARIRSWVRTGQLHPRYPGVYAYRRPDLPVEGELACGLLFAGQGSALTGLTQLWWMGYLHRRPELIHIDAPGKRGSRGDLRIHHPRSVFRALHRGLPVATLPRCLLLASADLSHDSLRLVLARAEFAKQLSLPSLQEALASAPRGATAVRVAMNAHLPQLADCAGPLERRFVLLCERFGLPIPEPNVRIGRYRPDMLWRDRRLIVELDGRDAHSSTAQLTRDAARQAHLEALGFIVLRFTWRELELEPERVAAEVRAALAA